MAVEIDVAESAILSPKAKQLVTDDEDGFTAQNDIAESILQIKGLTFTGTDLDTVTLAVALQVNYQIESGLDPIIRKEIETSHSNQRVIYRGDREFPIANPQAVALIEIVRGGGGWTVVRGSR